MPNLEPTAKLCTVQTLLTGSEIQSSADHSEAILHIPHETQC